jgi:hypothetical protein
MTDHKATPEQWAQIVSWKEIGSLRDACLLDLLDRVETLEATVNQLRIDRLKLINAFANQVPDRIKLFVDIMPDDDNLSVVAIKRKDAQ